MNLANPDGADDGFHFLFDRHFDGCQILKKEKIVFFEAIDKNSCDFNAIYFSEVSDVAVYRLMESAALKILIMDERVAEVAFEKILRGEGNKPEERLNISSERLVLAKLSNIFIATHLLIGKGAESPINVKAIHHKVEEKSPRICVKILEKEIGKGIESLKAYYCEYPAFDGGSSAKELKPAVLILHQGLAESLLKDIIERNYEGADFKSKLGAFIKDVQKHIPYVVMDSGRGIPANLPEDVKFIPFSLIQEYLMKDMLSKHCLSRIIMRVIRRGNA
jgi:hypothetical protein